jgi:ATP-grasp domain, R2K clade family 2
MNKTASTSDLGKSLAVGAGGGAAVGVLTSLFEENPSLRETLRQALIGSVGGAAIGGGVHALGRSSAPEAGSQPVISSPTVPAATPKEGMSLPIAALSGMIPGIGPAVHGAMAAGPMQAAGSAAASFLPAMAVSYPAFKRVAAAAEAGQKIPMPGRVRAIAALASILGATGAAHAGNTLRAGEMQKTAGGISGVLDELSRLVSSPMKEEGLFGKAVKNKIKGKSVLWHGSRQGDESGFQTGAQDVDFLGPLLGGYRGKVEQAIDPLVGGQQNTLARIYSRIGGFGKIDVPNPTHARHTNPAAVFDISGAANERGASKHFWDDIAGIGRTRVDNRKGLSKLYPDATRIHASPTTFGGDKLREAKVFPSINETHTLATIFPRGIPRSADAARAALERKLGANWIVKSRTGLASSDTNLTDKALGSDLLTRLRETLRENKGAKNVIAQRRSEAKEVGPFKRWVDETFGVPGSIGMKKKEYRVHVVNGKVVPYATYGRGNMVDYATTLLNPFRSKEVRDVEAAVQKAMNAVKNKSDRFKASYGFDVGVDKAGKPFIVETNPSEGGIASSWFDSPFVADSTIAAAKGELPKWVKLRNSVYGAGTAAGVAGVGYNQMNKSGATSDNSPTETLARLGVGALAADTGWNAAQLARDAGRMRDLHAKGIDAFRAGGLGTSDKARLLQGYADHAGGALNRRVLGIPAHLLLQATTPSADAGILDRLRAAIGGSVSPAAGKEITDSRAHYGEFARNPRLAMLREVMTGDPTSTVAKKRPATAAAKAVNAAMGNSEASPDLKVLLGGKAHKDKALSASVRKGFSEFFLGGQKSRQGLRTSQALSWGLTPYANAMRPAAGIMGAVSLAGLLGAGLYGRDKPSA